MSESDLAKRSKPLSIEQCVNSHCPWSGDPVSEDSLTVYRGQVVGFCKPGCRDKFASAILLFEKDQ